MTSFLLSAAIAMVWQGLLLVLLTKATLRFAPRMRASVRHHLWWATLVVAVALPWVNPTVRSSENTATLSGTALLQSVSDAPGQLRAPRGSSTNDAPVPNAFGKPSGAVVPGRPFNADRAPLWSLRVPPRVVAVAACVWAVAVAIRLLQLLFGLRAVWRLDATSSPLDETLAEQLRRELPSHRPAQLRVSDTIPVPVALGFGANAIVFPSTMIASLDATQLRHVTLHELAHLMRRDDWSTLLLRLVQSLLFFAPAVHIAARHIEFEQEMACDEWALGHCRTSPPEYAESLVRIGELALIGVRANPWLLPLTSCISTQLGRRVHALLAATRPTRVAHSALTRFRLGIVPLPVLATLLVAPRIPLVAVTQTVGKEATSDQPNPVDAPFAQLDRERFDSIAQAFSMRGQSSARLSASPLPARELNTAASLRTAQTPSVETLDIAPAPLGSDSALRTVNGARAVDTARAIDTPRAGDTARVVDQRRIVIPRADGHVSSARVAAMLATGDASLRGPDAASRAMAAFELSQLRERAAPLIPALLSMLADTTPVARVDGGTSVAWWASESAATTAPSEEAAKALLFIGRGALRPLEQFSASHGGPAKRRADWALGLLRRFD